MSASTPIDLRSTKDTSDALDLRWGSHRRRPGLGWPRLWRIGLTLLALFLAGCATDFARYNAGNVTLLIGDRTLVQRECEHRGVALYSTDAKIFGCTDFAAKIIVSVPDPKVLAHEMCHWTLHTASHEVCRPPVLSMQ